MNLLRSFFWIAAVACGLQVAPSAAAEPLPAGAHMTGGVGGEDQQRMQDARKAYNLHLTFAEAPGGAYLADVVVKIAAVSGAPVFGPFADNGPLFYAKLSPGVYQVSATHAGVTQTKSIKIGEGAIDEVFRWTR